MSLHCQRGSRSACRREYRALRIRPRLATRAQMHAFKDPCPARARSCGLVRGECVREGAGRLQQRSRITKSPRPTPLTGREHVGGGTRSKSPEAEIDGKETVTNCSMLYTEGLRGDSWDRNEDEEVRGSQLPALDTKAAAVFTSINALPRPCRPAICRPHADSAGSGSWTS